MFSESSESRKMNGYISVFHSKFFNFSVPRFLAKVLIDFFINNLGFCSFTLNLQKNENMDLNIFFYERYDTDITY